MFSLQILPLRRPIKWERVETFSSPSARSFSFPVEGGQTMELAVAQFWSSGIGSQETTIVDFEVRSYCYGRFLFLSLLYFLLFYFT